MPDRRTSPSAAPQPPPSPRARLEGCARALAAAGIDETAAAVVHVPVVTPETARAAAHARLDTTPELTAIFAFSDRLAMAVCSVARERGRDVPQRTVCRRLRRHRADRRAPDDRATRNTATRAALAVEPLLQAISGQPSTTPAPPLPTRLIARATTTGPPRAGAPRGA